MGGHGASAPLLTLQRCDLPDGLSRDLAVQPFSKNFSFFRFAQISNIPCHPPPEGRFAIVTDVRRDAVDADALLTRAPEADGEVVWF